MARTNSDRIALLSRVPLFSGCSDKELKQIGKLMSELRFPKGTVLTKQGQPGDEAFVLAEGSVDVTIGGKHVATLGAGEILGEMSLLDHGPRVATATAASDVTAYVLNPLEFESVLDTSPPVARKILRTLAERLRAAEGAPHA